jgi:hypothetical protein
MLQGQSTRLVRCHIIKICPKQSYTSKQLLCPTLDCPCTIFLYESHLYGYLPTRTSRPHSYESVLYIYVHVRPATPIVPNTNLIFADSYESTTLVRVFSFVHSLSPQPASPSLVPKHKSEIHLWCSKKRMNDTQTITAPISIDHTCDFEVVITRRRAVACAVVMIDGHRGN